MDLRLKEYRIQTLLGWLFATATITGYYYLWVALGFNVTPLPVLLEFLLNTQLWVGWLLHFVVGLIFTYLYQQAFYPALRKIRSRFLRGMLYGAIIFVISEIAIGMLDWISNLNYGYRLYSMGVLLVGDILFSIVLSFMVIKRDAKLN